MKELETADFERKKRDQEEAAESKTAKNRAKRQKKKERAKGKGPAGEGNAAQSGSGNQGSSDLPIKKRRLVNGQELVFKKPGEGSGDESGSDDDARQGGSEEPTRQLQPTETEAVPEAKTAQITIVEED